MRYGLQFATGNPFPQDVELGVQLQPEAIIEVPPECPECPECPPAAECEVVCRGWDVLNIFGGVIGKQFWSGTGDKYNGIGDHGNVVFIPQGEWCGHKRRFVVTPLESYVAGDQVVIISNDDDGETAIAFGWTVGFPLVNVTYEIDLTDAEEGSETWTTVCASTMVLVPEIPG